MGVSGYIVEKKSPSLKHTENTAIPPPTAKDGRTPCASANGEISCTYMGKHASASFSKIATGFSPISSGGWQKMWELG